ncbi:putative translation initiation inhibitor, yjgF family protein [Glaesserella parasuis]|nr:putative translation initiation inhibitor, yjgF family protein [Glaesserella parasuis]
MIQRFQVGKRLSEMAIYNGVAYLAGQVPEDDSQDMYGQTKQVLAEIDKWLAQAGTNKSRILMAQVFVSNMIEFDEMNRAWDEYGLPKVMHRRELLLKQNWLTPIGKWKL